MVRATSCMLQEVFMYNLGVIKKKKLSPFLNPIYLHFYLNIWNWSSRNDFFPYEVQSAKLADFQSLVLTLKSMLTPYFVCIF